MPILENSDVYAGYKIELTLGPDRSSYKEFGALITLWESGKHFHGGGDSLMYFCFDCRGLTPKSSWRELLAVLDKKAGSYRGCGGAIPGDAIGGGIGMCPNCERPVNTDLLTNPFPFWGSSKELAQFIARYFRTLKSNADIYCKYHPTDIRYKAMEQEKGLEVARRLRGLHIYPLHRVMRDISAGASLENRFKAFFSA